MEKIVLVDAGSGNLQSVQKALERCGARVQRSQDADEVYRARKIVLPGVGAFGDFMRGLERMGLDSAIQQAWKRGAWLLGICVGMQAFFEMGEEDGEHKGLGLLEGRVVRFPLQPGLKVPHTGWNRLEVTQEMPLFRGFRQNNYVYFNHSYYCAAEDARVVSARTDHGIVFASAVQRGNLFGVQFHPEKSQVTGLQILRNFLEAGSG
ncbi:MAG: imidazole glycerol phosphate synthase subunit HisH [Chloroflexota bacterium]